MMTIEPNCFRMKAGLELTDIPEGFLIPVVATLGVVGNLGKKQFLTRYVVTKQWCGAGHM